jgi:hypothetical protein
MSMVSWYLSEAWAMAMATNAELAELTQQAMRIAGYLDLAHAIVDGKSK